MEHQIGVFSNSFVTHPIYLSTIKNFIFSVFYQKLENQQIQRIYSY